MPNSSASKREKITLHSCMSALNLRQIFTHLLHDKQSMSYFKNKINNQLCNLQWERLTGRLSMLERRIHNHTHTYSCHTSTCIHILCTPWFSQFGVEVWYADLGSSRLLSFTLRWCGITTQTTANTEHILALAHKSIQIHAQVHAHRCWLSR